MTLRTRLALAFALVVVVPLLVGAALVARGVPREVDQQQRDGLVVAARLTSSLLVSACDTAGAAARAAGRSAGGAPGLAARTAQDLVDSRLADGVRVTGPDGAVVASAGTPPAAGLVADCASGTRPASGPAELAATVDLQTPGGAPAGRAVASFVLDREDADRLQRVAGRGTVGLLADGRVVTASGPLPEGLVARAVQRPGQAVSGGGQVAVLVAARPGQPWDVLVAYEQAGAPVRVAGVLVLLGLSLLAAVGVAAVLARATAGPLGELADAAGRVAAGDLSPRIEVRSRDEVGRLGTAFNAMTEELRASAGALAAGRDELQAGLARVGETLSGTHDLDRLLAVVVDTAVAATRASEGQLLLLEGGELVQAARAPRARATDVEGAGARLPLTGIAGRAAGGHEVVAGRAEQLSPAPGEPTAGEVLAVPMRGPQGVLGVLLLAQRRDDRPFDDDDAALVRTLAAQAVVAVDNVRLHAAAQRMAVTDALTGVGNRVALGFAAGRELDRALRFGRPLSLLMLDLDHFKAVNDTHGHDRGDAVLVEFAARVLAEVRDIDVVARYGGEELVVLLPESDERGAALVAARLCQAVRERPFGGPGELPVPVSVSVGVAVHPLDGTTLDELLRRADAALYAAKAAGRDTWRLAGGRLADAEPH